ncbi:MAG: MFS transporter [Gemmatimonadetes bacterium]|jgi:hypothetical protein|nr:MFS transporter [Gemmatimonadota bacterium]MBT7863071.1 MFS transporter [Gemmatimonadota bacterium]
MSEQSEAATAVPDEGSLSGNQAKSLSPVETGRALRAFIQTSGIWGAWVQIVGIGTPVLTGYALWLGATEVEIAYFISVVFFTSLAQVASPYLLGRSNRRKTFVFVAGCFEIVLYSSIVLIPLVLAGDDRILAMGGLVALAMMCGQLVAPIFNEWLAVTTPQKILGKFTARRTNAHLLMGIVAAYLVGRFIDFFPEPDRYMSFTVVYAGAAALGIGGYLNLMRIPFRAHQHRSPNLLIPFRDRRFRILLLFYVTLHFGLGLAMPFYSVYMLKTLQFSYARIALLNGLYMAAMAIGFALWGTLVDRYGGRAILQILVLPAALGPALWSISGADFYAPITAAMILNGLVHAGIAVSTNTLLYAILPDGNGKASYFAGWFCSSQIVLGMGAVAGGLLAAQFKGAALQMLGFPVGNLQIVFLISSGVLLLPNLLMGGLKDGSGATPRQLFNQIGRGSILSYFYGSVLYDWASSDRTRARATWRMGSSRSPMALGRLTQALDDASPEIRRHAALGLGEARSVEAVVPLLEELADEESDIRSEAVIALGRIGDRAVIDPLLAAIDDADPRVRISAINALAEMGGEEAEELLFWIFGKRFDRLTFPTLAEALARVGDRRMIRPTLDRLCSFRSPAIRLQLLNTVCVSLGAGRRFYQTISLDELARARRLAELAKQTRKALSRAQSLSANARSSVIANLAAIEKILESGSAADLPFAMRGFLGDLRTGSDDGDNPMAGKDTASIAAVEIAIETYLQRAGDMEAPEIRDVYLIVCLWCLGKALAP